MKTLLRGWIGLLAITGVAWGAASERGATLLLQWQQPTPRMHSTVSAKPFLFLGPMLGNVSSTQAMIWGRASGPAQLAVRVGPRDDLTNARQVNGPKLVAESGFMGTTTVAGLEPSRRYYYCLLLDGQPAMLPPYPSFTTPPPEGTPGHLRFAFVSCVGYHGYDAAPSYADMASRTNLDLVLMLGDNHYANTTDPVKQRAYYADQRRQAGWRELAAHTPIYAVWDDHDFGPDNSDSTLKGKARSLQTFKEHWANPAYGETNNPGVYFKFTRDNVEFFMLDDRYHRSPNKVKDGPNKTMLGAEQVAWLKRELLASTAPIKVLAAGGEWESHGTDDSWASFARERDDIFQFIRDHNIKGVLLISGDRHFTGAYQVQGRWIEVTSGPLGSSNAKTKNLPEMFLNLSDSKAKYYCIYDLDTRPAKPAVTLEVYRVGEGLVTRRAFTWAEVLGEKKIPPLAAGATTTK